MEAIGKDVTVVGLGAFGSAALWRLAERGAQVAGIGELLARIVTGERPCCQTSFLNPGRFRSDASRNGVAGKPGCAG